jgi:hypothetical protein
MTDNGTEATATPRNDFRTRCTFAMACMQLGIAFADLCRFGVQVAIPPGSQQNAQAQAAMRNLEAAIAVLNATARTDAGLIVPQ